MGRRRRSHLIATLRIKHRVRRSDYADYGLVYFSQRGTPLLPRDASRMFKGLLAWVGLPATTRIHDLRHAAATLMLARASTRRSPRSGWGYSTVQITLDLHTHAVKGLDQDAAARMQQALRAARQRVLNVEASGEARSLLGYLLGYSAP